MPKAPQIEEAQPQSADADVESMIPKKAKFEGSFGPQVNVKITKFGSGKVSTGKHVPELGDEYAAAGAVIEVDQSVADALEKKGFAEIQ